MPHETVSLWPAGRHWPDVDGQTSTVDWVNWQKIICFCRIGARVDRRRTQFKLPSALHLIKENLRFFVITFGFAEYI